MSQRQVQRDGPTFLAPFEQTPLKRQRRQKLAPAPPGGIAMDATNLTGVTSAVKPSGKQLGIELPGIQPAFGPRPNGA
jgi:hypothetical protein